MSSLTNRKRNVKKKYNGLASLCFDHNDPTRQSKTKRTRLGPGEYALTSIPCTPGPCNFDRFYKNDFSGCYQFFTAETAILPTIRSVFRAHPSGLLPARPGPGKKRFDVKSMHTTRLCFWYNLQKWFFWVLFKYHGPGTRSFHVSIFLWRRGVGGGGGEVV